MAAKIRRADDMSVDRLTSVTDRLTSVTDRPALDRKRPVMARLRACCLIAVYRGAA
jgi:hypothetical protein